MIYWIALAPKPIQDDSYTRPWGARSVLLSIVKAKKNGINADYIFPLIFLVVLHASSFRLSSSIYLLFLRL